jgi:hypothetical protein
MGRQVVHWVLARPDVPSPGVTIDTRKLTNTSALEQDTWNDREEGRGAPERMCASRRLLLASVHCTEEDGG